MSLQLEANNRLPLLWMATVSAARAASLGSLPTGSLGVQERAPLGFSIPLAEALDLVWTEFRRRHYHPDSLKQGLP